MADIDSSVMLDVFIQHVQLLTQDNSYLYLKYILEENTTLRERNHNLEITNDENHRTISKLQQ
jgi:chromosome segregation ATPase